MYYLNSDIDVPLAHFTCDYIDGALDSFEIKAFEEYLSRDQLHATFVHKSRKGMQALKRAYSIQAADDFEEKLFKRIAQEREEDKPENCTSA